MSDEKQQAMEDLRKQYVESSECYQKTFEMWLIERIDACSRECEHLRSENDALLSRLAATRSSFRPRD